MPPLSINPKSIVNNPKNLKMKKLFAIAIISASLAACNNSGESKSSSDTTTVSPDTTSKMAPDTSANKMMPDTSKTKKDTSAKK